MKIKFPFLIPMALGAIFISSPIYAKRIAPAEIPPIEKGGYRYFYQRQHHKNSYRVYIICEHVQTGNKFWKTMIYQQDIDKNLEPDIQDIFLKKIALEDKQLIAEDENDTVYRLNRATGALIAPKTPHYY